MTDEYLNRRTFAIISHPDAGKTTLTEKLLLASSAIRLAGEVKAKGERRRAHSDWMSIEQKRGISVTTSAMTFEFEGNVFNLLDTPGHEDFSEDTYRTLTAVDSAIMVVDAAKGIEPQTRKLFEVCRLRDIPIITFINKVDREGRDPFDLIEEISDQLALDVTPKVWPIGTGGRFRGCYDMDHNRVLLPAKDSALGFDRAVDVSSPEDPRLDELVGAEIMEEVRGEMELAADGYSAFDLQAFRDGTLTPVYFGSALRQFTIAELLRDVGKYAPPPGMQKARIAQGIEEKIAPNADHVSGFVFKVQANMDPNHRDRIAFVRMCSGKFQRKMKLKVTRTNKSLAVANPIFFLAQDRQLVEEAVAGDIVGIPNHGALGVGDTLTERDGLQFLGLPDFAPEIIRRVRLDDPMKSKQMKRAMIALAEEGASQVFTPTLGSDFYVGVVGSLQLDVIQERLKAEYDVAASLEVCGYDAVRWLSGTTSDIDEFIGKNRNAVAHDRYGSPVFLARSQWEAGYTEEKNPKLKFLKTRERV